MKFVDDRDEREYRACVWMTAALKDACANDVDKMLTALAQGRQIRIDRCDDPKPGFPYAPHDTWSLHIDSTFVVGESEAQVKCKMLGLILNDGVGFPLFGRGFQAKRGRGK